MTRPDLRHLLPTAIIATLLAICHASHGKPAMIEDEHLQVTYSESGELTIRRLAGGVDFVQKGRLSHEKGHAKVAATTDTRLGKGQALEVSYAGGDVDRISIYPDSPFVFVQPMFKNGGAEDRNVKTSQPFQAVIDTGTPVDQLKALGTAGLTALDQHSGSFSFLALADPDTRRGVVGGWLSHDRGDGIVFSAKEGANATLRAQIDYGRLLIKPGETADGEIFIIGLFDDARLGLEQWADLIARRYDIKLLPQPDGYCTWYSSPHGGASDEKHLAELSEFAAKELKPYGFSFVQIDDYWQEGKRRNGPAKVFDRVNPKGPYPNGMKKSADHIKSLGMTPGIWFMPFAGDHEDPFFADKQHWFLKKADGTPYFVRWGGTCIDMTHPEAREYLKFVVNRLAHEWGYTYFKMDGMWVGTGAKLMYVQNAYKPDDLGEPKAHDPYKTPLEAYRSGLQLIRDTAGADVFILGCCASQNMRSFGGTFGLVDAMRIGPDNGSGWKSLARGPWHGSNRYFLHGRIWYNDPDPVYVRASMPVEHARLICSWVAVSGQLNVSSEWFASLPDERLDILKRTLPTHTLLPRPVDLFETDLARIWLLTDGQGAARRDIVGLFNWSDTETLSVDYDVAKLGLAKADRYVGFDYWANRFVAPFSGKLRADLPGGTCRVLAVRSAKDRPQVISTSRHIAQGLVDLVDEKWDAKTKTLSGISRLVGHDPYELRIVAPLQPQSWAVRTAKVAGDDVSLAQNQNGPRVRLTFTASSNQEVYWSVSFDAEPAKADCVTPPIDLSSDGTTYDAVQLRWNPDDAATAWRVERDDGRVTVVSEPALVDPANESGGTRTYSITTVGWTGSQSKPASIRVAVPKAPELGPCPPKPTVYLSDLKAAKASTGWGKVKQDSSCGGKPITIGKEKFTKGVGVHANSLLTYRVKPTYRRFVAVAGLDDEEVFQGAGSVTFEIYGDRKEMGETATLLAKSPILSFDKVRRWHFDVAIPAGTKELKLVVTDAGDGVRCDHADWAEAGFVLE